MGRLTKRDIVGQNNVEPIVTACKDCDIYKHLCKYKDLEEAGRLIEQKCGEWIKVSSNGVWWYECSRCGGRMLKNGWGHDVYSEFCPQCGANLHPKENNLELFDKAIETLDEIIEENLTQEEKDRRNWKFAGVQFVLSEPHKEE